MRKKSLVVAFAVLVLGAVSAAARVEAFANAVCFEALSHRVQGASAEPHAPITPTPLSKKQVTLLKNLFARAEASWQGPVIDSTCLESADEPESRVKSYEARGSGEWEPRTSQLTIETDVTGSESRITKRLVNRFEIGDVLYFSDFKTPPKLSVTGSIALAGNEVEILSLERSRVSFLLKRHVPAGSGARRPRAEIRQFEISGRMLKLTELYYFNEMLTGSRTWLLKR